MPEIGIRELKSQASEIIRAVREEQAEYVITHRGKPVAMIVPFVEAKNDEPALSPEEWVAQLIEIGRQIEAESPAAGIVLEQLFADRHDSFQRLTGNGLDEDDADAE